MVTEASHKINKKLIELKLIRRNSDIILEETDSMNISDFDALRRSKDFWDLLDGESADSQESDWMRYPDLGNLELAGSTVEGKYLPKIRGKHEISIVPRDQIMRKNIAPNKRLEPKLKTTLPKNDFSLP